MRQFFTLGLALLCLSGAGPAATAEACSNGLNLQSGTPPALPGRVVFQASDYALSASRLYIYDFAGRTLTQISQSWPVSLPINPQFSPDGKRIVFAAIQNNKWDIFVWTIGTAQPFSLTSSLPGTHRTEDVKWSADGNKVVFKQDGNIKLMSVAFDSLGHPTVSGLTAVTTNGALGSSTEASAPFLSPDNEYVYFFRGSKSAPPVRVVYVTLATGVETPFSPAGTPAYYPAVRDLTTVLYVAHTLAGGPKDQILLQLPGIPAPTFLTPAAQQLSLNDCSSDNSDPATVDRDYILFSNNGSKVSLAPVYPYRPVLGSLSTGHVWNLYPVIDPFKVITVNILGMSYTSTR